MEVRRNTTLAATLGLVAAVLAIGWLVRASESGSALDWLLCLLMAAVAGTQLGGVLDGRLPLLTADEQGIRVRLHHEWLGLPWSTLEQVVVEQRDGAVRDGRLVVVPRNLGNALEALLPSSRRAAQWQRRLHGAPLTVPLSIGTRCSSTTVAEDLRALAAGRTDVVAVRGRERLRLDDLEEIAHRSGARLGRLVSRVAGAHDVDTSTITETEVAGTEVAGTEVVAAAAPAARVVDPVPAARSPRPAARVELVREARPQPLPVEVGAAAVPLEQPVDQPADQPADQPVHELEPLPAAPAPVIGPEIRAARERAGLDVDALSERTRIRPHVLEAIEVDDFGPCGGDFYARGHLRTLARYLGLDGDALVAAYDEHYAHAPINARRVFEAELGTVRGGLRATTGGPRWSLVAAAVLVLLMAWGVARFFTEPPAEIAAPSPDVAASAGLAANREPITSPLTTTSRLTVLSLGGQSKVTVRDRTGAVLWTGTLHRGQRHDVAGVKPFRVRTDHGSATRVRLDDTWLGPVAADGGPARRTIG
jgi:hypothetical protein